MRISFDGSSHVNRQKIVCLLLLVAFMVLELCFLNLGFFVSVQIVMSVVYRNIMCTCLAIYGSLFFFIKL